jgi:phosphoribosylanthranilate isomerase
VLQARVERLGPTVDAFITDTYDPATGADGATGMTHDWSLSRALVTRSDRPVILAGGLTPDNVRAAILAVGPAGVDVHTGVEGPDGRKDAARVRRFVAAARAGFRALADRDA